MGYLHSVEMAGLANLDAALTWHLQSNHYPPVPLTMIEPCKQAIDAHWDGDTDIQIELPEGISYRGNTTAPAWAIIEQHHLDAWLEQDHYDDLDDMSD